MLLALGVLLCTQVNPSLQSPYAHASLLVHQEFNSLETVTEVDPMNVAEIFGNVGGFWGE